MGSSANTSRRTGFTVLARRFLDVSVSVGAVLWAVWLLVPWVPAPFKCKPTDGAYVIFSHIAFSEGQPWGTSTLHTSGPLGFLRFPVFYEPTYFLLLFGNALVAAATALLLDHLVGRGVALWARLPIVAAATWMLSISDEGIWLIAFPVSQLLIPKVTPSRRWSLRPQADWTSWPLVLSLVVCAVAANMKGTFLLMAAVLAAELAALELSGRRLPVISASFVLAIAGIAWSAGLGFEDWGPYARHILDSLSGYAESFVLAGSVAQGAALIVSVMLLLAVDAFQARRSSNRFEALVRWGALAVLVYMNAKGALVRQDFIHELRAAASLGAFFMAYVVVRRHEWDPRSRLVASATALGLATLFIVAFAAKVEAAGHSNFTLPLGQFKAFRRRGMGAAAALDARARSEVEAAIDRPWSPTGSVAVFGSYQSLLLGYSGPRVMFPIVASYEVWSPWTSRRQRDFLRGPDAPDYLLYTESPTSGELALTLAARYAEVERRPAFELLRRRPVPLSLHKRVVFEGNVAARDRIEVPADWRNGPAVAEVRYAKTFFNTVISAFYQAPEAFLVLFDGPRAMAKIRMNSLLSEEGIVLSGKPGVWGGAPEALLGNRFGLLTDERVDATALGFEAAGAAGDDWNSYFVPSLHVRIYIPEFG